MKTALILHGIEGYAGIHWQQWLHNELEKRGYQVLMPTLPNAIKPDRDEWLKSAKDLVIDVDFSKLVLVGHSLGVVTLLDLVESENKKVKSLVSVAGFGRDYGSDMNDYFLKVREINFEKVSGLIGNAHVVYGDNDPYVPQDELRELADTLGVAPIVVKKGGHLNTDAGFVKFPLLLELLEEK